jgi:transcriptional regulator with XRE-family HTH domain
VATLEQSIKTAATYAGLSQADIARKLGMSPQSFNSKLKLSTFKDDDMERIAETVGATYRRYFEFPDGTRI